MTRGISAFKSYNITRLEYIELKILLSTQEILIFFKSNNLYFCAESQKMNLINSETIIAFKILP